MCWNCYLISRLSISLIRPSSAKYNNHNSPHGMKAEALFVLPIQANTTTPTTTCLTAWKRELSSNSQQPHLLLKSDQKEQKCSHMKPMSYELMSKSFITHIHTYTHTHPHIFLFRHHFVTLFIGNIVKEKPTQALKNSCETLFSILVNTVISFRDPFLIISLCYLLKRVTLHQ